MLILSIFMAAQVGSGQLPPAQPIPPPDFQTANVLTPVHQLLGTFEAGNSAAMLGLVYPEGRVTATGERASGSGLRQMSWSEFAQRVNPDSRFQETISDPAVEIDGDAAMVWAPFVVRINGKVSNCGFDHFDLVRDNGAWKIMNLTFSSRVADCPAE
ncbi:nuclear transport factor 2 family protein [Sphingomonas sp. URHD0057]|uniref:nuclear transport factor 2 family protein n=1 Tax=Sphingomonas sp. URHD0057 TaxID=1380389 RepID=UPI00048DFB24|nr:nuclear transport factor 2 family protein [Sphingomonas sp. URHD0057]